MTQDQWKDKDLTERCTKVIQQERCKHGMLFETCALCQRVTYIDVVKVPIPLKNDDGSPKLDKHGKQRLYFMDMEVSREYFRRYR